VGRIVDGLKEPYAIAILPDHPTPIYCGNTHKRPCAFYDLFFLIGSDGVHKFDEFSAKKGAYGLVTEKNLSFPFLFLLRRQANNPLHLTTEECQSYLEPDSNIVQRRGRGEAKLQVPVNTSDCFSEKTFNSEQF